MPVTALSPLTRGMSFLPPVPRREDLSVFAEQGDCCFVEETSLLVVFLNGHWLLMTTSASGESVLTKLEPPASAEAAPEAPSPEGRVIEP